MLLPGLSGSIGHGELLPVGTALGAKNEEETGGRATTLGDILNGYVGIDVAGCSV